MRAWSDWTSARVVPLAEVAERSREISTENGQSTVLYESAAHPGWLVKLYRPGFPEEPDEVLDRLIGLPATMSERDREIVDAFVGWPVARVVDGATTVGVMLAKAPAEFSVKLRLLSGDVEDCQLELDHLVQDDDAFYEMRDWPPPTWQERMRVGRNLLAVAALFERHDVVYGDWSYANAFWSRGDGKVFVIDVDACGFGDRSWIQSPGWDDPLVPYTADMPVKPRLDVRTDRYKVALAVLRCLTGVRAADPEHAHAALPRHLRSAVLGRELLAAVTEPLDLRPLSRGLLELLETELDSPTAPPPAPEPPEPPEPAAPPRTPEAPPPMPAAPPPMPPAAPPVSRPAPSTPPPPEPVVSEPERPAPAPPPPAPVPQPDMDYASRPVVGYVPWPDDDDGPEPAGERVAEPAVDYVPYDDEDRDGPSWGRVRPSLPFFKRKRP